MKGMKHVPTIRERKATAGSLGRPKICAPEDWGTTKEIPTATTHTRVRKAATAALQFPGWKRLLASALSLCTETQK